MPSRTGTAETTVRLAQPILILRVFTYIDTHLLPQEAPKGSGQEPFNRKVTLAGVVVEAQHGAASRNIRQLLGNRSQRGA